jgi:uncharacterized damage-inducible protein DinB
MSDQPSELAVQLQASYDYLCEVLGWFEAVELEAAQLASGWTPKALLAHVAFWDDFQTRRMRAAYAGSASQASLPHPTSDNDQRAAEDSQRPWAEIVTAADGARQRMIDFARSLPPEALLQEYPEGERTLSLARLLGHMVKHTQNHTLELRAYAGSLRRWSRADLRHFLVQSHRNLMDSIAGLTEATILATPVCGHWNIRDVLVHVLSWNEFAYHLLKAWPNPDLIALHTWLSDPDSGLTNAHLLAARDHLDLIAVADELVTYHRRLLKRWDNMSKAELTSQGEIGWGEQSEAVRLFYEFALHEAEHAEQIWRYRLEY